MEKRENGKINFRELARSLGISVMTLYRVLNNVPTVRSDTRARVVEALNRHGYYTHAPRRESRVLFDFTDHDYLSHYGARLMKRIAALGCTCFAADHRKAPQRFFDLAGECDVAVFASIPDPGTVDLARKANPELYTITLSTSGNADVTLSPDNTRGGELAAEHFHARGHRHIAVHLCERHPTRMERFKGFCAELRWLDPGCRIDPVPERAAENTAAVLREYLSRVDVPPTGLLFLAGEFAENYLLDFLPSAPEPWRKLSVMTFDNPGDLEFRELHYDFDRVEFASRHLLDWAEYYITNRPMLEKRSPIRTCIDVRLVVTGSVADLSTSGGKK